MNAPHPRPAPPVDVAGAGDGPTPPMRAEDALATLGRILLHETSLDEILESVVSLAKRAIPGVDEASVTMMGDSVPVSVASTGQLPLLLDERQYEAGHGPCLDAVRFGNVYEIADLVTEQRWPDYVPRALAAGVRSSLSLPMPVPERQVGALNLYALRPQAFDDESRRTAAVFAGVGAAALTNAHLYRTTATLAEHLKAALASRAVIEQAKGIIMGERRCGPEDAFEVLVGLSQRSNRKLRDVAAALVESATRPE